MSIGRRFILYNNLSRTNKHLQMTTLKGLSQWLSVLDASPLTLATLVIELILLQKSPHNATTILVVYKIHEQWLNRKKWSNTKFSLVFVTCYIISSWICNELRNSSLLNITVLWGRGLLSLRWIKLRTIGLSFGCPTDYWWLVSRTENCTAKHRKPNTDLTSSYVATEYKCAAS